MSNEKLIKLFYVTYSNTEHTKERPSVYNTTLNKRTYNEPLFFPFCIQQVFLIRFCVLPAVWEFH